MFYLSNKQTTNNNNKTPYALQRRPLPLIQPQGQNSASTPSYTTVQIVSIRRIKSNAQSDDLQWRAWGVEWVVDPGISARRHSYSWALAAVSTSGELFSQGCFLFFSAVTQNWATPMRQKTIRLLFLRTRVNGPIGSSQPTPQTLCGSKSLLKAVRQTTKPSVL